VLNNSVVRAYSTNVPGVGYQVQVEGGSGRPAFPTNYNFPSLSSGYVSRTQRWDSIRIDLIKTAARVGNGPLEGGLYGQVYANPNPEDFYVRLSVAGGTILSPSCTVAEKSRNFTVRMGRVPSSDFNGIGSTSRETPFNVEIACQAAPGTIQSTVSMAMDATRPATQPGVLDINPVGPTQVIAGGVGIQLLDGQRKPVEFGKAATVGTSKDGNYVVPFVARYMQTGAQLQPGIANGTATFTLTHQ
jgi:type 1 fimbria pilin